MDTNFFENTQYKNKFTRQSLLLDITLVSNKKKYNITLPEDLKIDMFSEVFVDTIVTNNITTNNTSQYLGMLINIDNINIRTIGGNTGGNNIFNNNYFIPNEAEGGGMKIHKGRKQNYMGTIEPGNYRNFNITLSNLNNQALITHDPTADPQTGTFIIDLIIIEK